MDPRGREAVLGPDTRSLSLGPPSAGPEGRDPGPRVTSWEAVPPPPSGESRMARRGDGGAGAFSLRPFPALPCDPPVFFSPPAASRRRRPRRRAGAGPPAPRGGFLGPGGAILPPPRERSAGRRGSPLAANSALCSLGLRRMDSGADRIFGDDRPLAARPS